MISFLSNIIISLSLIIFAYFSWRKIEFGILVIVFCLPLYLLRLNIFGIPSTALELAIYILFIVWLIKNYRADTPPSLPYEGRDKNAFLPLIGGVRGGIIQQRLNLVKKEKTLFLGILLLLAGAVISTIFSSDLKASAGILKGWFFDPFLFFIILVSEIKTIKQRENVLKALFFSGAAVAVVSLLYWFGFLANGISYDKRLYSIYLSPNYLAMYLSPALIIGAWLTYFGKSKKYFWLILLLIIAIALYFTYSYSAWLAIFFAIILLVCFMAGVEKKPSFRWKLGFLSVLLIFIFLFFNQIGTDRFTVLKNSAYRSSFHSRQMIWNSAWKIGRDNWLIGIGPGNFQKYYLDYQKEFPEPYLEWAVPQPHNIFLAFWLETGILGLVGFIVILAWFFKKSLSLFFLSLRGDLQEDEVISVKNLRLPRPEYRARNDRNECQESQNYLLDGKNYLLIVVLFSVMVYTITHGLSDTTYWKNDLAIVFWILLALMVLAKK